jgi:Ni/Co efflux regulator RcnB
MKKQQVIKVIKANAVASAIPLPATSVLEKEPENQRQQTNTVQDWITERRETSRTEERSSFKQLKAWDRQKRKPRKKSNKS